MKKQLLRFSLIHLALACAFFALLGLQRLSHLLTERTGFALPVCVLHDFWGIYCPLCGGTRAVSSLLVGDIVGALRANAAVTAAVFFLVYLDAKALVRIVRNRRVAPLSRIRPAVAVGCFVAYFLLRNVLLLFGIDLTGDFFP